MLEPVLVLIISWCVAAGGGVISKIYNDHQMPKRDGKSKYWDVLITGGVAGLLIGISNASANPVFKDPHSSAFDIVYQWGVVFGAAMGIQSIPNIKESGNEAKRKEREEEGRKNSDAKDNKNSLGQNRLQGKVDGYDLLIEIVDKKAKREPSKKKLYTEMRDIIEDQKNVMQDNIRTLKNTKLP